MTDSTAEKQQPTTLSTADVANYLRAHPDFFVDRPDILYDMELPHSLGNTSSLLERQASVLRQRNTELRHKLNELVTIARDNDQLFQRIKTLGLALLEAGNLHEVASRLQQILTADFQLDAASLMLYQASTEAGPFRVTTEQGVQAALGDLLRGDRVICTTLRQQEMAFLFPGYNHTEGSAALIPLQFQGNLGLLALGSTDPNHFSSSMDTSFAHYVGDILSRRLYHLLR
ncbi:MAG: DUF484 family protein [Pseudomonadota bacterium]|nr:DUF484 family protein [Pseudomonadota bacterium]